MIAMQLIDVGSFMTKLLRSEIFDSFLFMEGEIQTNISYSFDGHINKDFYSTEELEDAQFSDLEYLPFSNLRTTLFELIKGKRTPTYFKFIFCLPPEATDSLLQPLGASSHSGNIKSLIFRLTFQNRQLTCTTGVSYRNFCTDKTPEHEWDSFLCNFLKQYEIPYTVIS